jgi:DNA polymerase III alpha subunit
MCVTGAVATVLDARKAMQYHNAWHNKSLMLATIPAEDPETYKMIQRADTAACFRSSRGRR